MVASLIPPPRLLQGRQREYGNADFLSNNYIFSLESFSVLVKEKGMAIEGKRIFDDKRKRCTVPDADSYRRVLVEHLSVCRERMEVT